MNKRIHKTLSLCLLVVAMLGGFYYTKIYKSTQEVDIQSSNILFHSEKELNDNAGIILYGSPTEKFEDRDHVNKYMSDGSLYDFYTNTNFNVKKVLKNSTSINISKNSIFTVIEPIGLIQEISGMKILTSDSYKCMEQGVNYIVYLQSNGIGGFSVINMSNGKFEVSNNDNTQKFAKSTNIDVTEKVMNRKHSEFSKDVLDRYS